MVIVVVLVFVLSIFIFSPVKLRTVYRREGNNDYMALELYFFWGVMPVRIEIPFLDAPENLKKPLFKVKAKLNVGKKRKLASEERQVSLLNYLRNSRSKLKYYKVLKPHFFYIIKKTKVERFHWDTEMGLEDAAQTGILTGGLWSIKGLVTGMLFRLTSPLHEKPRLGVKPVYNQNYLTTELDCIFAIRPGHIIITAVKMMVAILIYKKRHRYRGENYAGATSN